MNIPDEAARRYPHNGTMNDHQQDIFREVFKAGAEWARKEALEEAVEAVRCNAGDEDENGIAEGVSNWPDATARTYSFCHTRGH